MILRLLLVMALVGALSSCSHELRHKLGISKSEPAEFAVVSNPPLVVPPILELREPGSASAKKEESK